MEVSLLLIPRKEVFLNSDLFQLKYEDEWVHMYELAKVSLNNRGNEIKSNERRSQEMQDENVPYDYPNGETAEGTAKNDDDNPGLENYSY